ncbi:hypothetical protein [Streptomyces sp. NPDC006863]|uniref:hypothetical protein n=1 Tax=unclassified Streptomyces TaxID=2593676 RepID=UPI0033E39641
MPQLLVERDSWATVSGGGGGALDGGDGPGQGGGLVALDHGDVVGVLGLDQPDGVRLDPVQGVGDDERSVQVQQLEQGTEGRGFVRLRSAFRLGEGQGPVVGDGGEQVPADRRADPLSDLPSTAITCHGPQAVPAKFPSAR